MMRKLRVLRAEGNPLSHAVPQRFAVATQTPSDAVPEVKVVSREKPGRPVDPNEVKEEKPPSFNSWLASMKSAVVSTPEEPAPTTKTKSGKGKRAFGKKTPSAEAPSTPEPSPADKLL